MDIWKMRVQNFFFFGTNNFGWVYDELNVEGNS